MKNKGFSLLEIIVATSLIAITVLGIAALFLTAKRLSRHTILSISAARISQSYLNSLYRDVRQDRMEGAGAADNCFKQPASGCEDTAYVEPNFSKTITPNFTVFPFGQTYKVKLQLGWAEN